MKLSKEISRKELEFKIIQHGSDQYWESVRLRHDVLREHLNMVFDPIELDEESSSYHIACYYNEQLIGCMVLLPHGKETCQMRQVCVKDDFQGRGIGKLMVYKFEKIAKLNGFKEIFMHARNHAVSFYENLDYKKYDKQYKLLGMYHWNLRKDI